MLDHLALQVVDAGARPVHVALTAPSQQAVDEVFALASANGVDAVHHTFGGPAS